MRELMVVEEVLLENTFPVLLPVGASGGPLPFTGGQLRPTNRAVAARSARTSSREEESRSTDEEERLLTKRCIEEQWKNTWETLLKREKAQKTETFTGPDSDVFSS